MVQVIFCITNQEVKNEIDYYSRCSGFQSHILKDQCWGHLKPITCHSKYFSVHRHGSPEETGTPLTPWENRGLVCPLAGQIWAIVYTVTQMAPRSTESQRPTVAPCLMQTPFIALPLLWLTFLSSSLFLKFQINSLYWWICFWTNLRNPQDDSWVTASRSYVQLRQTRIHPPLYCIAKKAWDPGVHFSTQLYSCQYPWGPSIGPAPGKQLRLI